MLTAALLTLGLLGASMPAVLAQAPDQPTQTLLEQAASTPRGTFPRAFHGEQAYWTVIGEPDSPHAALLSEDGLLEPWPGGPSIEPFLQLDGQRIGWADVRTAQQLLDGDLPIPTVTWRIDDLQLDIVALAGEVDGCPLLLARYRLRNLGNAPPRSRPGARPAPAAGLSPLAAAGHGRRGLPHPQPRPRG
jgi:hypothetical protein